jgi:hypothetical protein
MLVTWPYASLVNHMGSTPSKIPMLKGVVKGWKFLLPAGAKGKRVSHHVHNRAVLMSSLIDHSMNSPKLNVSNTWWAFHKILWDRMNSICHLSITTNWTGVHSEYHLVSTPQKCYGTGWKLHCYFPKTERGVHNKYHLVSNPQNMGPNYENCKAE